MKNRLIERMVKLRREDGSPLSHREFSEHIGDLVRAKFAEYECWREGIDVIFVSIKLIAGEEVDGKADPNHKELPARATHCLKKNGVTLSETAFLSDRELLRMRNFGDKSLRDVRELVPEFAAQ